MRLTLRTTAMALGALLLPFGAGAQDAFTSGDPEAGEKVFRKCQACHMVGEDAKARVGPPLNAIVGAPFGHVEDYKYSDSLLELKEGGAVWNIGNLAAYLSDPKAVIPKGKMAFAGLRKDEDLADVIAYMASFGPDGASVDPQPVIEEAQEGEVLTQ